VSQKKRKLGDEKRNATKEEAGSLSTLGSSKKLDTQPNLH